MSWTRLHREKSYPGRACTEKNRILDALVQRKIVGTGLAPVRLCASHARLGQGQAQSLRLARKRDGRLILAAAAHDAQDEQEEVDEIQVEGQCTKDTKTLYGNSIAGSYTL